MAYNKYFGAFTKKPPQKAIMETGARPKGVDTYLDKMAEQRKAEKAQERRVYQAKLTQETRESGAKRVEEAEAKAAGAKKAFDDYMISDERKQRTAEQQKKQEQNRFIQHLLTGTSDIMQPEIIQDDKETQLRKASEDAKQEAAQAKRLAPMADYLARFPVDPEERSQEERTTVEALREFDQMPYADRAALESYAVNGYRDQNLPVELAGIIPTAQQEAAGLIARYGKDKVDRMAAAYMRWQNAQLNEQVAQKSREAVDSGAGGSIGHNLASVAANVGGGIVGTLGQLQNRAMEAGIYGTVDPNAVGSAVNTYVDSVRDETFQNITGDQYNENGEKVEDGGALRQGAGYLYQAAMSAADSVARMWAAGAFGGGAGLASGLAATQAFSRSMAAASANGATPAQAALSAAADATWEYLSEKIPLDKLIDMTPQKNFHAILGNVLKQAGIEIVGEEANLVASLFSQAFILKEKSDFNLEKQQYMAQGMSEEEATKAATANLWEEAKQTAIVAGMSGGFQGATQTLTGAFGQPDESQNVQQEGNPTEESPVIEAQEESPLSAQQDPVGQDTESAPVMPEEAAGAPETRELDVVTQAVQQAQQNREAAQNAQQEPTLAQLLTPEQRVQEAVKGVRKKEEDGVKINTPETGGVWNKLRSYTQSEKENWKYSKRIVLCDGIENFRQFVSNALTSKEQTHKKMYFGAITQNLATEIKNAAGVNVEGYNLSLGEDEIRKIKKSHGNEKTETSRGQRPVTEADYLVIPDIVQNADSIKRSDSDYEGKPALEFRKRNGNELTTVVAVVSDKRLDVFVQTAYINKKGGSIATPESVQADSFTPVATGGTAPVSEDPQGQKTVHPGATPKAESAGSSKEATQSTNMNSSMNIPAGSSVSTIPQLPQEVNENPAQASDNLLNGQQPAPEGMKGTGAAEQNFTGKEAYNATLSAGNAQADRRDDVRTMELPKRDVDGKNVSAVTGNVYGSKITPDELASLMEEPVARGDFTYAKISNDQATKRAVAAIESAGTWETAFDGWKQDVTKGVAGAEVSARGALLLNRAAETGNKQQWLETLHYMQMLGTNTAQGLQALRIVRTLSIPDKMAFTRMTVNNYIAALAKDGVKIKKGGINALLDQYESASDDVQRDAILSDIQQNIADQVPSTFMEKWNALRYTNMLGNLKTQDRNILGNVGMSVNYKIKDKTAAVIENLVYHLSGKKFERTKSLRIEPQMKRAAMADFKQFADIVSDGGKYGDQLSAKDAFARGVEDKRTILKSENRVIDAFLKPMEKYRRATNWAMNNEYFGDEAFGRSAYANALAGYLQAHGIKDADLSKVDAGLMDKARSYAIQQAQEATFHDNSAFARTMSKLQKNTGILGQALLPFPKTPANVGTRAVELSPLGFLKTAVKAAQKAASGNEKLTSRSGALGAFASKGAEITGADIVDSLAKNLTGTGLFVLGCALRNAGLISGGADEDEEKESFDKLNGEQNYAFLLPGGGSYTLDWLNPTAVPLFMGANLWDTLSEKSDLAFADLEQVLTAIAEPMLEMSMLQGVSDALDSVKYSDNNLVQLGLNAAVNYLSQGLTNTALGQLEKSTEEKRMTTYVDKDSQVPVWAQKALGKASQKIPGWDYQQAPYINARGKEEKQPTGVEGLLYNTLSPGYYKEGYSDDVTKELNRLYETPEGDGSLFPSAPSTTVSYTDTSGNVHKEYHMTAEESETLRNTYGQTYNQVLGELVKSKDYQVLSDKLKVNAAQLAQEYATERGKAAALADYPQATGWMAGIEGREAEAIVRKVTTSALNDAISAVFTRTKNGWNTKEAESGMEKAYTEYEALSRSAKADILDDATTETRRYLEARTAGISQERYLSAAKEIATAKPAQGEDTVTQIRRMELLADEPLSPRQKETLMKMYASEKQQQVIDKVEQIGEDAGWTAGQYLEIYASAYRLHEDYTHGRGKKSRTIQKYMKEYDMDWATASALYKCFS